MRGRHGEVLVAQSHLGARATEAGVLSATICSGQLPGLPGSSSSAAGADDRAAAVAEEGDRFQVAEGAAGPQHRGHLQRCVGTVRCGDIEAQIGVQDRRQLAEGRLGVHQAQADPGRLAQQRERPRRR